MPAHPRLGSGQAPPLRGGVRAQGCHVLSGVLLVDPHRPRWRAARVDRRASGHDRTQPRAAGREANAGGARARHPGDHDGGAGGLHRPRHQSATGGHGHQRQRMPALAGRPTARPGRGAAGGRGHREGRHQGWRDHQRDPRSPPESSREEGPDRSERRDRGGRRPDARGGAAEPRQPRDAACDRPARGGRRRRPAAAGDPQPDPERRRSRRRGRGRPARAGGEHGDGRRQRAGQRPRYRDRLRRGGLQPAVRRLLHHQAGRHGDGAGDQPLDHRVASRADLGNPDRAAGRDLPIHAARRARMTRTARPPGGRELCCAANGARMRLGRILFGAVWSAATLAAPTASADEFKNPQVIRIRAPGGDLSIRARRGTASIPGLGEVEQVYGYEVFQGAKFSPGRRKTMELMPPVLSVDRGSTLRILYRNELLTADAAGKLQPTESNLHTHGLLVSAKGAGFAGDGRDRAYGDCIFVMASTSGAGARNPAHPDPGASGDPCSADPGAGPLRLENGEIHYGYVIAPDHPSGMYWFHPHPHQRSEGQVSNGLSGLLSVGDFWDTAYNKCLITSSPHLTGTGACQDLQDQRDELQERIAAARSLDIKYLGLKDIQVSRVNGPPGGPGKPRFRLIEFPLRADPADRSSREAFDRQTHARHHRCGDLAVRPDGVAYVDGGAAPGQCWKKQSPDDRWIFTVSGQVHPRITIQAGHAEVWHLANIGADMTYRLRLETVEERPRLLAFDVRALDGAAFPPETQRRHSEIVLMPGARVDVLIQRCDPRGSPRTDCADPRERIEARLRTVGVATGLAADDGDRWPAVDLASVIFESGSGERQVNFGSAQPMAARPSEPEPPSPAASPAPPRSAGTACEPTRYQAA